MTIDGTLHEKINLMAVYLRAMLEKKAKRPALKFKLELVHDNVLFFQVEFSEIINFRKSTWYFFSKAAKKAGITLYPRFEIDKDTKWSWGEEDALLSDNFVR